MDIRIYFLDGESEGKSFHIDWPFESIPRKGEEVSGSLINALCNTECVEAEKFMKVKKVIYGYKGSLSEPKTPVKRHKCTLWVYLKTINKS